MENYLINHCAPTLAGCKVGNIFTYKKRESEDISTYLKKWNNKLNSIGIFLTILRETEKSFLIYVYNKENLKNILSCKDIKSFLYKFGYKDFDLDFALFTLKEKLKNASKQFPHEIGIFLGYPLCDVLGFIENNGKSYKKCGKWKVYGNKKESIEIFQKYDYCKHCFKKLFHEGYKTMEIIEKYNGGLV